MTIPGDDLAERGRAIFDRLRVPDGADAPAPPAAPRPPPGEGAEVGAPARPAPQEDDLDVAPQHVPPAIPPPDEAAASGTSGASGPDDPPGKAVLDAGAPPPPALEEPEAVAAPGPRPSPSPFARPLPRVLAIANQKGGVGKTTTAVNLGASLAGLGYRVLVIDLDPQGNATTGLGINRRTLESSVYDVLMHDNPLEDAVEPTSVRNLFVVPATMDLAGAEIELVPEFSGEL